ncbi:MAG: hypothetical protein U9N73_13170 [Candidatus Auribacterota bacterium]|nr:hypothetical protein [Candidatus Auribacterota bacterium]
MKNVVVMVTIAAFLVVVSGCGGGKYADVKEVMNTQADMMEEFAVGIENAQNSDDVLVVLAKLQKTAEGNKEEMMAVAEKYPEIQGNDSPPEELKEEMKRMQDVAPKFFGALMKIGQDYGDNDDVREALDKMKNAMQP